LKIFHNEGLKRVAAGDELGLQSVLNRIDEYPTATFEDKQALIKDLQSRVAQPTTQGAGLYDTGKLVDEAKSYGYDVKMLDKKPTGYQAKHFSDSKTIEVYTKGQTPEQINNA